MPSSRTDLVSLEEVRAELRVWSLQDGESNLRARRRGEISNERYLGGEDAHAALQRKLDDLAFQTDQPQGTGEKPVKGGGCEHDWEEWKYINPSRPYEQRRACRLCGNEEFEDGEGDRGPTSIARCPEHGLHGERTDCFACGGPVEQVPMVPALETSDHPQEPDYLTLDEPLRELLGWVEAERREAGGRSHDAILAGRGGFTGKGEVLAFSKVCERIRTQLEGEQ